MKIHIDIDLQPQKTSELKRLAECAKNIYAAINLIEEQMENYRQRLEQLEQMTTHIESPQQEN